MNRREDEGERGAGMISHNGSISGQTLDDPLLLSLLTQPIVYHATNSRVPGQNSLQNRQIKFYVPRKHFELICSRYPELFYHVWVPPPPFDH